MGMKVRAPRSSNAYRASSGRQVLVAERRWLIAAMGSKRDLGGIAPANLREAREVAGVPGEV
jgi:hypothetical protein